MRGGKEPWYSIKIETDGEIKRETDQERNQQKVLARYKTGLLLGTKGRPPDFERGFRTYLKVKSSCLLQGLLFFILQRSFVKN